MVLLAVAKRLRQVVEKVGVSDSRNNVAANWEATDGAAGCGMSG